MRRRVALLVLLLASAAPAVAQDAATWFTRMTRALIDTDYQGELVYVHGNQVEALRVFHAAGSDGERERLISLNGHQREVVRADGQVTCIGIGARPAIYADASLSGRMLPAGAVVDLAALQRHYAIALGGDERVAGLAAQVLVLQPRDAYRYGYRLWLERDTGLPLKSTRFGADGRPVEQLMFTRIALGERPSDADLQGSMVQNAERTALIPPRPRSTRVPSWRVIDPPPGFVLSTQQPVTRAEAEHLLFSDGLASVSVYVEPLLEDVPPFSGPASRGAINLFGRVTAGQQITVLGDVPAATVERFARSVAAPDR